MLSLGLSCCTFRAHSSLSMQLRPIKHAVIGKVSTEMQVVLKEPFRMSLRPCVLDFHCPQWQRHSKEPEFACMDFAKSMLQPSITRRLSVPKRLPWASLHLSSTRPSHLQLKRNCRSPSPGYEILSCCLARQTMLPR